MSSIFDKVIIYLLFMDILIFLGNVVARNNLGYMYQHGEYVEKDLKEAYRYYKLAEGSILHTYFQFLSEILLLFFLLLI